MGKGETDKKDRKATDEGKIRFLTNSKHIKYMFEDLV